jgi:hypothetical protein
MPPPLFGFVLSVERGKAMNESEYDQGNLDVRTHIF